LPEWAQLIVPELVLAASPEGKKEEVGKDTAMYDTSTERHDQSDEEALNFDISDTALEAAAGEIKHKAGSQTISFCSGIDTCPS
jgi:hypothetical protein